MSCQLPGNASRSRPKFFVWFCWAIFCGPPLLTGCGNELATVSGNVTLDGKPLTRGTVVFQAQDMPMAVGKIQTNGTFTMQTGASRGMLPGTYGIKISAFKTEARSDGQEEPIVELLTPARYNQIETSGLSADVRAGSNRHNFQLHSK